MKWEVHIKHFAVWQILYYPKEKHLCPYLNCMLNKPLLFMKQQFLFKRVTIDELWFFRLGNLSDSFMKINKVSLSLQVKQVTVFVASDKT